MSHTLFPTGNGFPAPHAPDGDREGRGDRRLEPVLGLGAPAR